MDLSKCRSFWTQWLVIFCLFSGVSCTLHKPLTSGRVIETARAYHLYRWTPSEANVKHGLDEDGILVHTPDLSLTQHVKTRPGFWSPDKTAVGLPYQWGGFETPESFDKKIAKGFYAGDVYTIAKRQKLGDGVSKHAAGVDCSGFVSRCWGLSRHHSTRELPDLCEELPSYSDLKAGDILNVRNDHVVLFWKFTDDSKTHFYCYEVGCPPSWHVSLSHISVDFMKQKGYKPYRYKKLLSKS